MPRCVRCGWISSEGKRQDSEWMCMDCIDELKDKEYEK